MASRRRFLRWSTVAASTGIAGCGLLDSGGSTTVPEVEFGFEYDATGGNGNGSLTISHDDGDPVTASRLQLSGSGGAKARWNELGSTDESSDEEVTEGSTAIVDGTVLNWPSDVTAGETVRQVFVAADGSPTELDSYTVTGGSATPTATEGTDDETATVTGNGTFDSFENGSLTAPDWRVEKEEGTVEVVEDGYDGRYALRTTDPGNGDSYGGFHLANKVWLPLSDPVTEGTVFSTWVKTNAVGVPDHRSYQVGDGAGYGTGTYMSMRFRKGRVRINGDAMTAGTLYTDHSPGIWYKFEMEVLGDGEVEFRLLNSNEDVLASEVRKASNSSDYSRVELWSGDKSDKQVTAWFDRVRYSV